MQHRIPSQGIWNPAICSPALLGGKKSQEKEPIIQGLERPVQDSENTFRSCAKVIQAAEASKRLPQNAPALVFAHQDVPNGLSIPHNIVSPIQLSDIQS